MESNLYFGKFLMIDILEDTKLVIDILEDTKLVIDP